MVLGLPEVVTSTQDRKANEEHGKSPKKFEDVKLEALLEEEGSQAKTTY